MSEPLEHAPNAWWGSALALSLVCASMAWLWGYTVDDALITARVAHHLAAGAGYRFNVGGPVVDAVTPLGFACLLAPLAGAGPLSALFAAKWLGAAAYALSASWLGREVFKIAQPLHAGALVVLLAGSVPLSAWAAAGMETGLVTALCIAALGRGAAGALAATLAAGFRPELMPWCACIRAGLALARKAAPPGAAIAGLAPVAGFMLVGAIRYVNFDRAAPLALVAKQPDLSHGLAYASAAAVQTGLPLLVLAPLSLWRGAPLARAVAAAGLVHFIAVALAGGDWMSLYRLVVPILPSFVLAGAELSRGSPRAGLLRWVLAAGLTLHLGIALGPVAREVGEHRARLIEAARPALAGARSIAALDIGWVGATTRARVIDLAGITDPAIALLAGGHTSKRVDDAVLRTRDVDTLVLLATQRGGAEYAREVERRVALLPSTEGFVPVARLPLGGTRQEYVILRAPTARSR
jgi:hypothetical protein